MARFANGFIDEVLEKTDIVALISEHVPSLKGAGDRHKGLCPFHQEKTPSFTVSGSKGVFFCFGCRKGGNALTFIQEVEGLPTMEAVKYLAQRAGVQLRYTESREAKEDLKHRDILEKSADYYQQFLLKSPMAKEAREYLDKRGVSQEMRIAFRLGYAPAGWNNLCDQIHRWGVPFSEAEKTGLIIHSEKNDSYYDRFRHRVIFPITDSLGHVLGFGGRALSPKEEAKYLNSPETELFKKSQLLYGLHVAKDATKREKEVIITEGYMDVIALHQFGVKNSVAVLGTALSSDHLQRLKRYAERVLLVFDSDAAGQKAAVRSTDILAELTVDARVLTLPKGDDPDSFVHRHGSDGWKNLVTSEAVPPFDFRMRIARENSPGDSIQAKSTVAYEMLAFIAGMPRAIDRSLYLGQLSSLLGIPQDSLVKDLEGIRRKGTGAKEAVRPVRTLASTEAEAARRGLFSLVLSSDTDFGLGRESIIQDLISVPYASVPDGEIGKLFDALLEFIQKEEQWEASAFLESLEDEESRSLATEVLLSEPPASKPEKQWRDCLDTLKRLQVDEEIRRHIRQCEANPSVDFLREVHQPYQALIEEHGRLWDSLSGRSRATR